jgi:hypothetical protein
MGNPNAELNDIFAALNDSLGDLSDMDLKDPADSTDLIGRDCNESLPHDESHETQSENSLRLTRSQGRRLTGENPGSSIIFKTERDKRWIPEKDLTPLMKQAGMITRRSSRHKKYTDRF